MRTVLPFLLLLSISLQAQNFDDGFHFYMPPGDSTAQRFLPEFAKQPITDFVGVSMDGHFEAGGERLRFWGVNVTNGACFPKKNKAPWVAARMRKLGINLVRFNGMDNTWAGDDGSIFYPNSNTTQVLNFFTLDKLHYFLAQLKQQGIYANINLHVERRFQAGDGVLNADSIQDAGKAVTIFDRQLIALQKQYAQQLLTPVSLYTGLALTDDPVMAMVEITDENSLYSYWRGDRLQHFSNDGMLMQRHCDTLDLRWNQFLQNKYANQASLATAWNDNASTPGSNQQLLDNNFENGNPNGDWKLELHDAAAATLSIVQTNPFEGQDCALVSVTNVTGTGWHIQFKQENLSVEAGKTYTVHFAARAEQPATIYAYTMRNLDPWTWYGSKQISLTPQWQEFSYTFIAPEDNADFVRFAFSFENQLGNFYFDKMSLADAGATGVILGESLASGNFRRIIYGERLDYTLPRVADMTEFYLALQRNYFMEMRDYLRNELGVQVPISGSNSLGGPSDVFTHQDMDYVDDHGLWDYPAWYYDGTNWNWEIMNTPMVKSDWWTTPNELFSGLAMKGKPFTLSQYYHAFPNRYEVEMMPWMAAYGAFHDADAIVFYEYNNDFEEWEKDMVEDFYLLNRNSAQMALSPMYAYAYRNGLISAASNPLEITYSKDYMLNQVPLTDNAGRWGTHLPYNSRLALTTAIRTAGFDGTGAPDFSVLPAGPGLQATTSTGETSVDAETGILKTVTPQFVSICGFVNENGPHEAGPLKVLSGNDFAAVSLLSLNDKPIEESAECVLTISSKIKNTNMTWQGNSVNNGWGQQPTELFPMQLSFELTTPVGTNSLRIYPLSPTGEESSFTLYVPVSPSKFLVNVDQSVDQTLWYGVEASTFSAAGEIAASNTIRLSPNPATARSFAEVSLEKAAPLTLRLMDAQGRSVKTIYQNNLPVMAVREAIEVGALAPGTYLVECRAGDWVKVEKLVVE
ncbi:MAG: carbohydrate binding domain-containing protein [Saprospiraceae bacterium]|nr:carbohydrate binding domain-containing protein [Saprospiraceae bacterium]